MNLMLPVVLLPATAEPGCPDSAGTEPESGSVSRAVCGMSDLGSWVSGLPARLWHLAVTGWPWLLAAVLVVLVLTLAVSMARRLLWVRAARRGYWVAITPPRTVDPVRYDKVWRVLDALAARAHGGPRRLRRRRLRLLRMPMAFEVYADHGRLRAGLWLPEWVPYPVVAKSIVRAWPGSAVDRAPVPTVDTGGSVAGFRLMPDALFPETGWLVDDPRPRTRAGHGVGDRDLGTMWSALGEPGGPVLLQVLVRPASRSRRTALRRAVRSPVPARRTGAAVAVDALAWLLLRVARLPLLLFDLFLPGPASSSSSASSSGRSGGPVAPDALQRAAMNEAAEKARDTPHLLVAVRAVAARADRGAAVEAARAVADGFGEASRALWAVRLRRAAAVTRHRWASGAGWLLLSASELGVLAHLPADPAFYGFDTAALHRPLPGGIGRADPERPTGRGSGWNRRGWTTPPAEPVNDDGEDGDPRDDNDEDDDDSEAA